MEAEGPTGDHPDLVVQPFDDAVGDAPADVGDDVVEVRADGAGNLDEPREPTATRPAQPLLQLGVDDNGLPAVEDVGECLLEQVGSIESVVVPLQR